MSGCECVPSASPVCFAGDYRIVDVRREWDRARTRSDECPRLGHGYQAREQPSVLQHLDGFTHLQPLGDASEVVAKVANGRRLLDHARRPFLFSHESQSTDGLQVGVGLCIAAGSRSGQNPLPPTTD
jgi:hypothetical protein